jgi:hypothetical protein
MGKVGERQQKSIASTMRRRAGYNACRFSSFSVSCTNSGHIMWAEMKWWRGYSTGESVQGTQIVRLWSFPMPTMGVYRLALLSQESHGEPHFTVIPKCVARS